MGIFRKPANSIGEVEASLPQLRRKRDVAARTLVEAQASWGKAEIAWQAALDSDDSKALERAGARLAEAKEFAAHLETARADYDRQINEAELALAAAKDRAAREAKADILDSQAAALPSMFEAYLKASGALAEALAGIEGMFDADAAGSLVLQTRSELEGARDSIIGQMQWIAGELRRDPPPRSPEPPNLRAGVLPRFVGDRNDPHEPWLSTTGG